MTEAHNGTDAPAAGLQVVRGGSVGSITTDYLVDLLVMVWGVRVCHFVHDHSFGTCTYPDPLFISHQRRYPSLVHTSTEPAIATANAQ